MTSAVSTTHSYSKKIVAISDKYIGSQIDLDSRRIWEASASSLSEKVFSDSFLRRFADDGVDLFLLYGPASLVKLTEVVSHLRIHAGVDAAKSLVSNLSAALVRLPNEENFTTWLSTISQVAVAAPNQVSVICNKSQVLLSKVDAIGFHRWVSTGLTSAGSDAVRLERYFSLEDAASRQVVDLEASTVRLDDIERSLAALPMGFWRKHIILRAAGFSDAQNAVIRTSFDDTFIRIPTSYEGFSAERAEKLFKAAITHIGAHIEHSGQRRKPKALKPIQIAIISILEDTRAELLAARKYPGLMRLWRQFHTAAPMRGPMSDDPDTDVQNSACFVVADTAPNTENLLARLARALIDPSYKDDSPWVVKGLELFFAAGPNWSDPEDVRRIGVLLGNDLGQMRLQFNSKTYTVQPPYRDDNQGLWDFGDPPEDASQDLDVVTASVRTEQSESLSQDHDRQRHQEDTSELGSKRNIVEQDEDIGIPVSKLSEWDYLAANQRSNWVTIVEHKPPTAPANIIAGILNKHADVEQRISRLVSQSKIGQSKRLKRQREGDRLDLDACIQQRIDTLAGQNSDGGIYESTEFSNRDLSVLVLLDISESTKDLIRGTSTSVFHLERDATALLAEAMHGLGDPFAIHAFCSNGRHDLRYFHIKDFGSAYNDHSKSKLAGLRPGLSTRMGGALRHASSFIKPQKTKRKLVLVITDGEPSDIDIKDPKYLVEDSRKAVMELASQGVDVFAVGLDGSGHTYLPRIFGQRNMVQIENVESLPERLPMLYFRLVG